MPLLRSTPTQTRPRFSGTSDISQCDIVLVSLSESLSPYYARRGSHRVTKALILTDGMIRTQRSDRQNMSEATGKQTMSVGQDLADSAIASRQCLSLPGIGVGVTVHLHIFGKIVSKHDR